MDLTATWLWIRHGPTHSTALNGWTDVAADLSDASALNWLNARIPADALVVASDLKRASATADAFAGSRTRLPDSSQLREINFGDWEGKTADHISRTHPIESRRFWADPTDSGPPGGECWSTLTDRTNEFVDETVSRYPGRTVVAVAHFGTILTQAMRAANARYFNLLATPVLNLSVTHLSLDNGVWTLHEFSELSEAGE